MDSANQPPSPEVRVSQPAWLGDAKQSAILLGRLVQDPSIQAALILRGKDLWAQAGELLDPPAPDHAAAELAQKVFQYWSTDGGRDLTRYVRLSSVPGEYILYATGLTVEMVLAILYNEATPFSKMRIQAAELAHTLLSSPLEDEPAKWIQEYPEGTQEENPALEAAIASLPPLFDDVPPPTVPSAAVEGAVNTPVQAPPAPGVSEPAHVQADTPPAAQAAQDSAQGPIPRPAAEPLPVNTSETVSSTLDEEVSVPDMEYGAPPLTRPAPSVPLTLSPLPAYLPVSSPALSDLYLAVALLPRLPRHHLIGDLAALLPQWISQICMAYAWRLEAMRVRPDYVEWVVNIPPATSASLHLRIMRRQTSQFIFAEFPTIARENPSGDFWASGYLVTSSSQLPTEAAIQAFISQVRQQQGVSKLFPERS